MGKIRDSENCGPACREAMEKLGSFAEEVKKLAKERGVVNMVLMLGEDVDADGHKHTPTVTCIDADLGSMLLFSETLRDRVQEFVAGSFMSFVASEVPEPSIN